MITLNQIQKNIAEAISHSGMTQSEIARKIGVSQQTISHYVKGNKMPALDTFALLCEVLEVNPNDILSEKNF